MRIGADSRENTNVDQIPRTTTPQLPPGLEPEDYYLEGPYVVFTAAYHLKRGSCCGSNCRHCPYKEKPISAPGASETG